MQKQIRYAAVKWNDLDGFTSVKRQSKDIFDELQALRKENFNLQLRLYCKNEARLQHIKELWDTQASESPVVISSLRRELKLKTNLLTRAASASAEHKQCIAQNEVKIAQLKSYINKLESTAGELTAAKTQIKVLGKELEIATRQFSLARQKIQELAVKNSYLIDRLNSYKNILNTKSPVRYGGAKWNEISIFNFVTRANRHTHDENKYFNHCKGKGKNQYVKELCAAQVKKLNVAITTLRKEVKLQTNLLMQAAITAAELKECIARNEMKIAELQSHTEKLESTADELKEAKRQIEALAKQVKKRDETVVSCESKIKELSFKNSKLSNHKTKELLITQRKLLDLNMDEKQHILQLLTGVNSYLRSHQNLVVNSTVPVKVLADGISYHEAMARNHLERNEQLVRILTKENKYYKSNIKKLESSNYIIGNLRFNFLMEAIPKSFLNPSGDSNSSLLLSSSLVPSVDNDLLASSSELKANEGFWGALISAFLRVRDRVSRVI